MSKSENANMPKQKNNKAMKIALIVSISVNVLFLFGVIGRTLAFRRHAGFFMGDPALEHPWRSPMAMGLPPLPREFGKRFKKQDNAKEKFDQMAESKKRLVELLKADTLNKAEINKVLVDIRNLANSAQEDFQTDWLEVVMGMEKQERIEYLSRPVFKEERWSKFKNRKAEKAARREEKLRGERGPRGDRRRGPHREGRFHDDRRPRPEIDD